MSRSETLILRLLNRRIGELPESVIQQVNALSVYGYITNAKLSRNEEGDRLRYLLLLDCTLFDTS